MDLTKCIVTVGRIDCSSSDALGVVQVGHLSLSSPALSVLLIIIIAPLVSCLGLIGVSLLWIM